VRKALFYIKTIMKIQTNLRAGAGQKRKSADTTAAEVQTVDVPVVPVSRCAGI
jgi:CRISPR/Cas system CMR subunit Cmr4 (Cas7 group RAMP superfamily)